MTAIVGLIHGGTTFIGGDSSITTGNHHIDTLRMPKVQKVGQYLIGAAGYIRTIQLILYGFSPPVPAKDADLTEFMVTTFSDALRTRMTGIVGEAVISDMKEAMLVAVRDRLFVIHHDFAVEENDTPYAAVGSGRDFAMGSMFASSESPWTPEQRIINALTAAEKFEIHVRGPFYVMKKEHVHAG